MRYALALLLAVIAVTAALDLQVLLSAGPAFATGRWGRNLGTGVDAGLECFWKAMPALRFGAGLRGSVYGQSDGGSASVTMLQPHLSASLHLIPESPSFDPGLSASFGMARSVLRNDGGEDPATWDPFWSAGFRWEFSVGGGLRGLFGADYTAVMAREQWGDSFAIRLGLSGEVTI